MPIRKSKDKEGRPGFWRRHFGGSSAEGPQPGHLPQASPIGPRRIDSAPDPRGIVRIQHVPGLLQHENGSQPIFHSPAQHNGLRSLTPQPPHQRTNFGPAVNATRYGGQQNLAPGNSQYSQLPIRPYVPQAYADGTNVLRITDGRGYSPVAYQQTQQSAYPARVPIPQPSRVQYQGQYSYQYSGPPPPAQMSYQTGNQYQRYGAVPTLDIPESNQWRRMSIETPIATLVTVKNMGPPSPVYSISSDSADDLFRPPPNRRVRPVTSNRSISTVSSDNDPSLARTRDAGGEHQSDNEDALFTIDETLLMFNHNDRFDSVESPPAWYIQDPETFPKDDPRNLCATCRHINIKHLYTQPSSDARPEPDEFIRLGTIVEFVAKFRACGLCHFIMRLIAFEVTTKRLGLGATISDIAAEFFGKYLTIPSNQETEYFMYPNQFKSTYNVPAVYICRGPPPNPSLTALIRPDYLLGFREVHTCCRAPNTGRHITCRDEIDIEWIKEQLELCDERSVGAPTSSDLSVRIRVVDVHRMCIVDLGYEEVYATLSYVWGEAKQVRLIWETESLLCTDRGLIAFWDRIPKTIRDAITLTRKIGLDYLWIDALCIRQDDPEDQMRLIKEMGSIYKNSTLTIMAQCGDDAAYGLPGVDPGTRDVSQMLGHAGKSVVCNMLPDYEMMPSTWESRAWTMQENVLSQRKLVITDQACTFWCVHTLSSEDTYCRHRYWPAGERYQGMLFFKGEHSSIIPTVRRQSNFDTYAFMVSDFSQRKMKYQSDAENAMLGVLDAIKATFKGRFLYGIPDAEIDTGLLWYPLGAAKRRIDLRTGKPLFPSWSWLGWEGHACYPWATERATPLTTKGCPTRWHDCRANCRVREFETKENRPAEDELDDWERCEEDPWCWKQDSPLSQGSKMWNPITYQRIGRFLDPDTNPHRLQLRTLTALFRLSGEPVQRPENYNVDHEMYHMDILDTRGFRVGAICIPSPEQFSTSQESIFGNGDAVHEFIVLSRASIDADPLVGLDGLQDVLDSSSEEDGELGSHHLGLDPKDTRSTHPVGMFDERLYDKNLPYCLFNVMMIEWDKAHEVAERVTVGRMHVKAFVEADPCMKNICLE